jgi:hypothetical protein
MRTPQRMLVSAAIAAAIGSGCTVIVATQPHHHDDYDDCDRCHYTVTLHKSPAVDSTAVAEDAPGS